MIPTTNTSFQKHSSRMNTACSSVSTDATAEFANTCVAVLAPSPPGAPVLLSVMRALTSCLTFVAAVPRV
jgi:hypothetical protein